MTDAQKMQILKYREEGLGHTAISRALGLSLNTIKSYCRRNLTAPAMPDNVTAGGCKQCGAALSETKTKPKTFCSDKCRFAWWNANRNKSSNQSVCDRCGIAFDTRGNKSRKYCTHACYIAGRYGGDGCD